MNTKYPRAIDAFYASLAIEEAHHASMSREGMPCALPSFDEFRSDYIAGWTADKEDRESLRVAYGLAFAYEVLATLTVRDETEATKAAAEVNRISVLLHSAPNSTEGE